MADGLRRLRIRTTIAATAVVGLALIVAAVALVVYVGQSLTGQVHDAAAARAEEVAQRVIAGQALPVIADPNEESIQVLGPGESAQPSKIEGVFLTVTRHALAPDGTEQTIVVERGLDDVGDARSAVAHALLIGVPGVLAVVALVTWWIAGVTLGPVRAAHERQRRFVADAAHELRSPVASIRQHAEVAGAHPESTDVGELAATVTEESIRLQVIVEDLLLLARLDEGALHVARDEVDLDDVVLAEAGRLRGETALAIDTSGVGAGRVRGEGRYLERLVRNLGENAVRHARGRVGFAVAERDGHVMLAVDDDGPGIAPEARERAFERFVRLDEGRDRTSGGTGLGLAIVREIARAHDGDVVLASSPLGGLRAEATFPSVDQTVG
ncbi:MAG: ATP-binding protein [Actinomycetota bacterium]